jgi:predicted naringenin-chalcone synthase
MPAARIVDVTFETPPLMAMAEYADLLSSDAGGDVVAQVIANSAIATKGMAVHPTVEDVRWWSTRRRMDRSLVEARALGGTAVSRALARAGLSPDDVGLFATVTTTTHSAPGLDTLATEVGMRDNVQILSMGPMGCYAALPALSTCANWVAVQNRPAVLLAVDLFSTHVQPPPYDKEAAVIFTLFGDGAAAVVLVPGVPGRAGADVIDAEQLTVPPYADDLQVHAGDLGMRIRLAPSMPDVVASAVGEPAKVLLARNGIGWDEVAWWAVHPGGRRILDRVGEALALPETSIAVARAAMRDWGNTAAPAVLGVLQRLLNTAPLEPGQHGVALTFGPGATIWSLLLRGA